MRNHQHHLLYGYVKNSHRNLLNIKDKNQIIDTDNILVNKVKYVNTKFIYGNYLIPRCLPYCGHVNNVFKIIKHGTKIKLPNISNIKTILQEFNPYELREYTIKLRLL